MEYPTGRATIIRLALLSLLITLLGLAPRAHQEYINLSQARRARQDGAPEHATRNLSLAAEQSPWRADLWEQAGKSALLAGDYQAAGYYLEHAERVHAALGSKMSAQARMDLGDAYQGTGDLKSAIQAWEVAIASGASPHQAGLRTAQAQSSLGFFSEAITTLNNLIDYYPDDPQILFLFGLLTATQDPDLALAPLKRAAELDPNLAEQVEPLRRSILTARISEERAYALVNVGRALALLDHWDLAAEAFYQASTLRPDYSEAWAFLAGARQVLQSSGNIISQAASAQGDGWADIEKALKLNPESPSSHYAAAYYWAAQDRYDLAVPAIQSAADLAPDEPDIRVALGDLLAASGDLAAAYQAYQQAIQLANNEPTYLSALVRFSLEYGYHISEVALPAARQAVNQAPQDPLYLDQMAEVLIQIGDLDTAHRFASQALERDPDDAAAHMHLGLIYILQGEREIGYQQLVLAGSLAGEGPLADQIQRLLAYHFPQD